MYDRLKYWLGAEPFLGVFVLAFAVPFAAIMLYAAFYGVVEHPWTVATYASIWCVSALLTYLATRVGQKAGKLVARASRVALGLGVAMLLVWDDFVPWRGFKNTMIVSILIAVAFIIWFVRLCEREDETASLPDYRARLD